MIKAKCIAKYGGSRVREVRDGLREAARRGIEAGAAEIKDIAVRIVRVRSNELKDSIEFSVVNQSNGKVYGAIRTGPLPQAMTLEFGTGNYSVAGTTADRIPWFVHESMINGDLHEEYGFPVMEGEQGRFYIIHGAKPHPYMKPAFDAGKAFVLDSVVDELLKICEVAGIG